MHLPRVKISLSSILFVVILLSMVVAGTAWAQGTTDLQSLYQRGGVGENVQTYSQSLDSGSEQSNLIQTGAITAKAVGISLLCELNPTAAGPGLCPDPFVQGSSEQQSNRGIQYDLAGLIGGFYEQPPATIQTYLADLGNSMNLGFAQPAYAQGLGFSALNPIIEVWKITRNLSFILLIGVLLVVGFMIMAGKRLGSKTEVTAQQAIPSLVITLLLITFSYAIAGLLIEGMYLVMWLMAGLFQGLGGLNLVQGNIFTFSAQIVGGDVAGQGGGVIGRFVEEALGGGIGGWAFGLLSSWIATIIILMVVIFNTFKIFFGLLRCYIEIILNIAFAPLILLTGALPGRNPFPDWIKSIIGNLAVFPALLLMLLIFEVLRNTASQSTGGFMPPYLGGNSTAEFLPFLAGLALVLALPNTIDEVKKALGASKGGLFQNLLEAGSKNFSQGAQYAPPILFGAPMAAAGGVAGAYGQRGAGLSAMWAGFRRGGGSGLSRGLKIGNEATRQIANIRDGRFLDPNSWENSFMRYTIQKQREEIEKKRKEDEASGERPIS